MRLLLLLCLASLALATPGPQYIDDESSSLGEYGVTGLEDYSENDLENIFEAAEKELTDGGGYEARGKKCHKSFDFDPRKRRGSRIYVYRRGCVRRGGNCDHRPSDCCQNSTCRCNLWGANCRCQRKGLFQKWGK